MIQWETLLLEYPYQKMHKLSLIMRKDHVHPNRRTCYKIPNQDSSKMSALGAWVTQSVKHPGLDFGSGHEIERHVGLCAESTETAWDSLSPSLPLPHSRTHSLKNKYINKVSASRMLRRPRNWHRLDELGNVTQVPREILEWILEQKKKDISGKTAKPK